MSYLLFKRGNDLGGWIVFLIAAFVYGMTIEPTASFWDCPEFISCAEKLQVGHPPGAPFYIFGKCSGFFHCLIDSQRQSVSCPGRTGYMVGIIADRSSG